MRTATPPIFPRPQKLLTLEGSCPPIDHAWLSQLPTCLKTAQSALEKGTCGGVCFIRNATLPSEGYELEITSAGVRLTAADAQGAFYGVGTLRQISESNPSTLPCLSISDYPALPVRGFMLDISRGKVPLLSELLALVESLSLLRINQFQLYVEHTFAFPGHEIVWREASPLTSEDLAAVGKRCRELGIELVPNLNTFGHLERWLRHEPYRKLAECPEGWVHPLTQQFKPHPSTLKPDQASLDFVAGLLDSYLPHFQSNQVNIGGDEPWELGQGASKEAVATHGKHQVYLEHLNRIHALVRSRGKRMQFWGDILLEDLALAGAAPAEALPIVWGYDPGHPFDAQCGRLAELGRDYLIAPGTSTWQSFTGRLSHARANAREAIAAAHRHGASGVLITTWGDNGNHQPWPTFWIPLAEAAALAWCQSSNEKVDSALAVRPFLQDHGHAPSVASALEALGQLDEFIPYSIRNKSLSWELLTTDATTQSALRMKLEPKDIQRSLVWLEKADSLVQEIGDIRVREELSTGIAAVRLALSYTPENPAPAGMKQKLAERYRHSWLLRARSGGLEESVGLLGLS